MEQSLSKAKIKFFKSLHFKKHRKAQDLFIVEGKKLVNEVLNSDFSVHAIIKTNEIKLKTEENLLIYEVDIQTIKKLSSQNTPEGILAIVEFPEKNFYENHILSQRTVKSIQFPAVLLDKIQDPGNLGTILRTAAWFGFETVLLTEACADVFSSKVLRASMGGAFHLDYFYVEDISVLEKIEKAEIVAADLDGVLLNDFKFKKESIILIGNEANGISEEIQVIIDKKIHIPKTGIGESLNAGVSFAIIANDFVSKIY